MKGHEVEWELLETVGPGMAQLRLPLQLVLQPAPGVLGEHHSGQAHVTDLKAAPQRPHSL